MLPSFLSNSLVHLSLTQIDDGRANKKLKRAKATARTELCNKICVSLFIASLINYLF